MKENLLIFNANREKKTKIVKILLDTSEQTHILFTSDYFSTEIIRVLFFVQETLDVNRGIMTGMQKYTKRQVNSTMKFFSFYSVYFTVEFINWFFMENKKIPKTLSLNDGA